MRKAFIFMLSIISGILCSQPSFDYATQPNSSEDPLGFVKYNNFTIIYSSNRISGSPNGQRQRVIGLNNDKSIKFDKVSYSGLTYGIIQYTPTYDKGMLTLSHIWLCTGPQYGYLFSKLTRIDSSGNVVFSVPPFGNVFRGVAQVSATNFIYGNYNTVVRFNGSTGASLAVVYTAPGNIITLKTTASQQIIVSTNSVVALIDTLGNLLQSKPSTAKYVTIKVHKNTVYALRAGGIILDKLDSVFNVVNSISTP